MKLADPLICRASLSTLTLCLVMVSSTTLLCTVVQAQNSTLFPYRLDPEGLTRSSDLTPSPILSSHRIKQADPAFRLAKSPQGQTWESTKTANDDLFPPSNSADAADDDGAGDVQSILINDRQAGWQTQIHAAPQIRVETVAPHAASTAAPSLVTIEVINQGPTAAEKVMLSVALSDNIRVLSTQPTCRGFQDVILFELGHLDIKERRTVEINVQATQVGQIDIRPTISSAATNRISLTASRPALELTMEGDGEIQVGSHVRQLVTLRNSGQNAIRNLKIDSVNSTPSLIDNIVVNGEVPLVDVLKPGESRTFELLATAKQSGEAKLVFEISGDRFLTQVAAPLIVTHQEIQTEIAGPELAYKHSTCTFTIDVANVTAKERTNVDVVMDVPAQMRVQIVDRQVRYDQTGTQLTWSIPSLKPHAVERIPFKAVFTAPGDQQLRVRAISNNQTLHDSQMHTRVIARAHLQLHARSAVNAVEVASPTAIRLDVTNQGTQPAHGVRLRLQLPELVRALPQESYDLQDGVVSVQPFALEIGETKSLEIQLTAEAAGEFVIKSLVDTDEMAHPITAENILIFFSGIPQSALQRD